MSDNKPKRVTREYEVRGSSRIDWHVTVTASSPEDAEEQAEAMAADEDVEADDVEVEIDEVEATGTASCPACGQALDLTEPA